MSFDQAQSPRLGQRTTVESTVVRMFAGVEIPEAAWRGQLIYRTDTQNLQVYNGTAWEDVVGGIQGLLTFVGPDEPTALNEGDLWYDTDDGNKLYRWDGAVWIEMPFGSSAIDPEYPGTIRIKASQLDSDVMGSNITVTGFVKAISADGAEVGLTGAGFFTKSPGGQTYVSFPVDGPVSMVGTDLEFENLSVRNVSIAGSAVLEQGSALRLATKVNDPITAPIGVADYDTVQLDLTTLIEPTILDFDYNVNGNWAVLLYRYSAPRSSGGVRIFSIAEYSSTGALLGMADLPTGEFWDTLTTTVSDSINVYLVGYRDAITGDYMVVGFNYSLTLQSSPFIMVNTTKSRIYRPAMGYDYVTSLPLIAWSFSDSDITHWGQIEVTGFADPSTATIAIAVQLSQTVSYGEEWWDIHGFVRVSDGYYYSTASDDTVRYIDGLTSSQGVNGRGWLTNGPVTSLVYSLGNWYTINWTGELTRYENGDYYWNGTDNRVWNATYTWADTVGTTHETGPSPAWSGAVPKRARLTLSAAARPSVQGSDAPNMTRFYLDSLSRGFRTLYGQTTASYYVFDGTNKISTTTQAPANNFGNATASVIVSTEVNQSTLVPLVQITGSDIHTEALDVSGGTDPAYIEALQIGTDSDVINGFSRGNTSGLTTDGSGDVTIAHGLPGTPVSASGTPGSNHHVVLNSKDTTNLIFRIRNTATGDVMTNASGVQIFWQAWL
jgi:hypothetical protein